MLDQSPDQDLTITVDNQTYSWNHFTPKKSNLRKINLIDNNGDTEGIWVVLSDKDTLDYDNDIKDQRYHRVACLRNNSLAGPRWGTYIPIKMMGIDRPVCDLRKISKNCKISFNNAETED